MQTSRDGVQRLLQRISGTKYLSEFRKITLTIPVISEEEQVDQFCQGLKPQVRLEFMKAGAQTIKEASRIALNIDAALFGFRMYHGYYSHTSGSTPIEIDKFEQRRHDREINACFKCHEVGCRPFK